MDVGAVVARQWAERTGSNEGAGRLMEPVLGELDVCLAAVLPADEIGRVRSAFRSRLWDEVATALGEISWFPTLVESVTGGLVELDLQLGRSDAERRLPVTDRAVDDLVVFFDRCVCVHGLPDATSWVAALGVETDSVGVVAERLRIEGGARLTYLAQRLGVDDPPPEAVEAVRDCVVADAGGQASLVSWGRHMSAVNPGLVVQASLERARPWTRRPSRTPESRKQMIDEKTLGKVGLGDIAEEEGEPLLRAMYEELELRLGSRLSEGMDDDTLAELSHLFDASDNEASNLWLQANRPDFRDVVAQCRNEVTSDMAASAEVLLKVLGRRVATGDAS